MEEHVAGKIEGDAFFVWQSEPTVIIGRNQDMEAEVNMDYCRENDVRIVRRKSGGGCVYSDSGNIMISFISRRGEVAEVFDRFLSSLTECLVSMGLDAERSERNDVYVCGRKVSGTAFHQLPDRSIVHGTLLYDTDMDNMINAITPTTQKLKSKGVESVRSRITTLKNHISISIEELIANLKNGLSGEVVELHEEDE
jgi:lipoic acid synthetase/lipoate-protein ligase A